MARRPGFGSIDEFRSALDDLVSQTRRNPRSKRKPAKRSIFAWPGIPSTRGEAAPAPRKRASTKKRKAPKKRAAAPREPWGLEEGMDPNAPSYREMQRWAYHGNKSRPNPKITWTRASGNNSWESNVLEDSLRGHVRYRLFYAPKTGEMVVKVGAERVSNWMAAPGMTPEEVKTQASQVLSEQALSNPKRRSKKARRNMSIQAHGKTFGKVSELLEYERAIGALPAGKGRPLAFAPDEAPAPRSRGKKGSMASLTRASKPKAARAPWTPTRAGGDPPGRGQAKAIGLSIGGLGSYCPQFEGVAVEGGAHATALHQLGLTYGTAEAVIAAMKAAGVLYGKTVRQQSVARRILAEVGGVACPLPNPRRAKKRVARPIAKVRRSGARKPKQDAHRARAYKEWVAAGKPKNNKWGFANWRFGEVSLNNPKRKAPPSAKARRAKTKKRTDMSRREQMKRGVGPRRKKTTYRSR